MADDQFPAWARALLQVVARGPVSEDAIRKVVAPKGTEKKQLKAYNLCDGTRTEADIAGSLGVKAEFMKRSIDRWVTAGVAFRLDGDGRPLHLYPVDLRTASTGSRGKSKT